MLVVVAVVVLGLFVVALFLLDGLVDFLLVEALVDVRLASPRVVVPTALCVHLSTV